MYLIVKRALDILISILALAVLLPLFILIAVLIALSSGLPVFYMQDRAGKNWQTFRIIKFRTMIKNADKIGPAITSNYDKRITALGRFLRKYKLDELPQFINVLKGEMSLIGPRPELLKYTNEYKEDFTLLLSVKPGISDYASIVYRNESTLIGKDINGENFYINEILPRKISLCKKYIREAGIYTDLKILFATLRGIIIND